LVASRARVTLHFGVNNPSYNSGSFIAAVCAHQHETVFLCFHSVSFVADVLGSSFILAFKKKQARV
jgi:hypothetical protein